MNNSREDQNTYGGESFQPFDFDLTVEPDVHEGAYIASPEAKYRRSNDGMPQIVIEWTMKETEDQDARAQRSVGCTVSDFLTLRPAGDRKGNFARRRLAQLLDLLQLDGAVMPTRVNSKADFDELIAAIDASDPVLVHVTNTPDRLDPKNIRSNVQYVAPRGNGGGGGVELEDEAPPPAKAKKSTAPAKKSPRR